MGELAAAREDAAEYATRQAELEQARPYVNNKTEMLRQLSPAYFQESPNRPSVNSNKDRQKNGSSKRSRIIPYFQTLPSKGHTGDKLFM